MMSGLDLTHSLVLDAHRMPLINDNPSSQRCPHRLLQIENTLTIGR